jgi:hypothetical protein
MKESENDSFYVENNIGAYFLDQIKSCQEDSSSKNLKEINEHFSFIENFPFEFEHEKTYYFEKLSNLFLDLLKEEVEKMYEKNPGERITFLKKIDIDN